MFSQVITAATVLFTVVASGLSFLTLLAVARINARLSRAFGTVIVAIDEQRDAHNATIETLNYNLAVTESCFDSLLKEDAAREDFKFLEPGSNALPS